MSGNFPFGYNHDIPTSAAIKEFWELERRIPEFLMLRIENELTRLYWDGYSLEWIADNLTPVMFMGTMDANGDYVFRAGLQYLGKLRETLGDDPLIFAEFRLTGEGGAS